MHRTQILLEPWQYEALKALARKEGKSLSQVLREIVTERLSRPRRYSSGALGRISGIVEGPPGLGADHDRYLYDLPDEETD